MGDDHDVKTTKNARRLLLFCVVILGEQKVAIGAKKLPPVLLLARGLERLGSCSIDDHARSEEALAFCRTVELQDGDGAWGARVVEHDSLHFQRVRRAAGLSDPAFLRSLVSGSLGAFASNSQGSRNRPVEFFWSSDGRFMVRPR